MSQSTQSQAPDAESSAISRKEAVRVCVAAGLSAAAAGKNVDRLNAKAKERNSPVPWLNPGALAVWYEAHYSARGLPEWLRRMLGNTAPPPSSTPPPPPSSGTSAPVELSDPVAFFRTALDECQRAIRKMQSARGEHDPQVVILTRQYGDLLAKLQDAEERARELGRHGEVSVERAAAVLDRIHGTIPRSLTRDLQSQSAAARRALADPDPLIWATFCQEFFETTCQRLVDSRFREDVQAPAVAA